MPIRGMTDQARVAFPSIGKLRKGGTAERDPQGNTKKPGADLEFFRFTSDRPEVQEAFDDAYGKSPALINVFLPHPTIDENWTTWKELWTGGGLRHRCDGATMIIWLKDDGTYSRDPKPCAGGCKPVGRLSVWIPELIQAGFVGFVTCETHGINDLLSIQGSLEAALGVRGNDPRGLTGIQWTLRRVKEKISTPFQGKRARRDKWLVKLEPAQQWVSLQLQQAHRVAMMLPAPRTVVDEETGEKSELEHTDVVDVTEIGDEPDFDTDDVPNQQGTIADADLRQQIEALCEKLGTSEAQRETWCQKKLSCSYEAATREGLTKLHEALAASAAKKAES